MSIAIGFAVLAAVLILSALVAGLVERAPLSFPLIFLILGFCLGPRGLGLLNIGPTSPVLELLAVITLSLILFLDAVNLETTEQKRDLAVPLLTLGPGTLLVIALGSLAAYFLLQLPANLAVLTGAILASTDPVVLRDVVRDARIPIPIRRALSIEAGANDIVVLPIVLVLLAAGGNRLSTPAQWAVFLPKLLLLGPLCGFVIGGLGAWVMARVDRITPIRREYQSLFGIGLVFGAYAAGVTVGVDGFLAAFAAGLAVTVLNQELCDCFLEYGEATAEIAMLLSFVLFGALLSSLLGGSLLWPSLALAAVIIFLVRPLAMLLVLLRAPAISWAARSMIAWFGPRGLTSLLFALLIVRSGLPQSVKLLSVVGTVVIASVVLHGVSATPLSSWYGGLVQRRTLREERESTASGIFQGEADVPRVTAEELAARLRLPDPPVVLDVRSRSQYGHDREQIPTSVRVLPDQVAEWGRGHDRHLELVLYCT